MSKAADLMLMVRIRFWALGISIVAALATGLFLMSFIQLTHEQTRVFLISILATFPLLYGAFMLFMRSREQALARYWRARPAGA
jgi:hypothetical protein